MGKFEKQHYSIKNQPNQASGADGVQTAVFRKDRANLEYIWAAAHQRALALTNE